MLEYLQILHTFYYISIKKISYFKEDFYYKTGVPFSYLFLLFTNRLYKLKHRIYKTNKYTQSFIDKEQTRPMSISQSLYSYPSIHYRSISHFAFKWPTFDLNTDWYSFYSQTHFKSFYAYSNSVGVAFSSSPLPWVLYF